MVMVPQMRGLRDRPRSPGSVIGLEILVAALLFTAPHSARADDLEKLLRRPLEAGSIALLAPHAREKGVSEKLKTALSSPKAEVRGVAARIVNLGGLQDLVPDVAAALVKELDPEAAREEIHALFSQGGAASEAAVFAAVRRLSPRLDRDFARIIARVRGPSALDLYYGSFQDLALGPIDRRAFFRLATREKKDQLIGAASRVLGHRDTASWKELLEVASDAGVVLEEPVILEALRSRDDIFRGETAWYLAKNYCENPPADRQVLLAALSETPGQASPADAELRFGEEILGRVLGRPPVEDEAWIACLLSNPFCHLDSDFLESPLLDYLTPRERHAILERNEKNLPPEATSRGKKFSYTERRGRPGIRLVGGLPVSVARDLASAGCRSTWARKSFTVASVAFRADGLPRGVSLELVPEPQCANAASAFFLLTSAPDDVAPEQTRRYIAIFDPDSMTCNESATLPALLESSGEILRVRAKVIPPKLIKRAEPIYPLSSRQNHEEGVSIYEAVITPSGCVRDLRVIKSSTPTLDVYGIDAISRWRYRPASLDGRPVAVYLTVTVTYTLK